MPDITVSIIPFVRKVYYDTKANLDALTGVSIGDIGYATDEDILYRWSGAAWQTIAHAAAHMYPIASAPQLYSANAPIALTELDISAHIGSNSTTVVLYLSNNSAGAVDYSFQAQAGVTEEAHEFSLPAGHFVVTYMLFTTNGSIWWKGSAAESTTIKLLGYLN